MSTNRPLVDILMPTYNHERYVGQAIESVLEQKTNFPIRLLVGDDCSTDRTQEVVGSYANKFKGKVEYLFSPVNLGALHRDRVSIKLLRQSTAKYIAILEGDDYWTDPHKLQKQVDFLEQHPECSVCFHNAEMLFENQSEQPRTYCPDDQKEISTLLDIAQRCFLIPCTVLFRNELLGELPECFFQVTNADWMMFVLLAEYGHLGYLNEVMARYRVHGGGIWSRLNSIEGVNAHINTYEKINAHLKFKYDKELSRIIAGLCIDQYYRYVNKGEVKKGVQFLIKAARLTPSQVYRPRRVASVLKYGVLGALQKPTNEI